MKLRQSRWASKCLWNPWSSGSALPLEAVTRGPRLGAGADGDTDRIRSVRSCGCVASKEPIVRNLARNPSSRCTAWSAASLFHGRNRSKRPWRFGQPGLADGREAQRSVISDASAAAGRSAPRPLGTLTRGLTERIPRTLIGRGGDETAEGGTAAAAIRSAMREKSWDANYRDYKILRAFSPLTSIRSGASARRLREKKESSPSGPPRAPSPWRRSPRTPGWSGGSRPARRTA